MDVENNQRELNDMNRRMHRSCVGHRGLIGVSLAVLTTVLPVSAAFANPVDNPGNAWFEFYNHPNCPFIEFANGGSVTSYDPYSAGSGFLSYVDSLGDMSYSSHAMAYHATSLSYNGNTVYVQLDIDYLDGITDLSSGEPDIDWDISARLRFRHGQYGGGDFDESECSTDYFDIHIYGDWGNTYSEKFTVPALDGSVSQNCHNMYPALNLVFDLGSFGAQLVMYKFDGYNLATLIALYGS